MLFGIRCLFMGRMNVFMATKRLLRKPTSSPDIFIAHNKGTEGTRQRVDAEQTIYIPRKYFTRVSRVHELLVFAKVEK